MGYAPSPLTEVQKCLYQRCREERRPGGGPLVMTCSDPIDRQWELREEVQDRRNVFRREVWEGLRRFMQEALL